MLYLSILFRYIFLEHPVVVIRFLTHTIFFIFCTISTHYAYTAYFHYKMAITSKYLPLFFWYAYSVYIIGPYFLFTIFVLYKDFYRLETIKEGSELAVENPWINYIAECFWPAVSKGGIKELTRSEVITVRFFQVLGTGLVFYILLITSDPVKIPDCDFRGYDD